MIEEKANICTKRCKRCIYSARLGTVTCCSYIIKEGRRRNCDIIDCNKYKSRKRGKKKCKTKK